MPEEGAGGDEDEKQEGEEKGAGEEEEEDTLSLGAEAVLHLVENSQEEQSRPSRTSATSLISSSCSRESLLQSREPDPEQVNSSSQCRPHSLSSRCSWALALAAQIPPPRSHNDFSLHLQKPAGFASRHSKGNKGWSIPGITKGKLYEHNCLGRPHPPIYFLLHTKM